ncbi:hypothetical protein NIES4074_31250 [Cylindrospermum sp. NIES-4074]|nr:hypothetical protein NIES4074_31250 [Cylindrospermum sp. NIES-4074]
MKTTPAIKPLLVASASTVLGLAFMSILGHAPADAAGFRVYGKFAPEAAITENEPYIDEKDGFFEGIINSDTEWLVRLFSSQGRPTYSFDSQFYIFNSQPPYAPYSIGKSPFSRIIFSNFSDRSSINFIYDYTPSFLTPSFGDRSTQRGSLNLFLDQPDFSGKITSESYFYNFYKPYYNTDEYAPSYTINVVDGYVEKLVKPEVTSVPEPSTIVGLSLASVMGWWTKRRKKVLQEV